MINNYNVRIINNFVRVYYRMIDNYFVKIINDSARVTILL